MSHVNVSSQIQREYYHYIFTLMRNLAYCVTSPETESLFFLRFCTRLIFVTLRDYFNGYPVMKNNIDTR